MKQQTGCVFVASGLYAFVFGRSGVRRPWLIRALEVACTFLFVVMVVVLFCQTMARVVGLSFFWAEELARYAMVWIVFLGSTVAVHQGSHTHIGVFVKLLPGMARRYVEALVSLACAAVIGTIAHTGIVVFRVAMMGKSSAMQIPLGYVFGAVTFCGALMAVFFVDRAARQALGKSLPEEFHDEEKQEAAP